MLLNILFSFCIVSNTAFALDLEKYQVDKNFTSDFKQERFIKSTDLTLKSAGGIKIKDGMTLYWNQKDPFEYNIVMTRDSISSGEEGNLKPVKEPMAKYMARIMFNLFNGSLSELKNLFEIKQGTGYISLKPRDKTMAKFIDQIRVEGQSSIEKIRLNEKSGNFLIIEFTSSKTIR